MNTNNKSPEEIKLNEVVNEFLNDLQESFTEEFAEPFPIRMPYRKLKKIATIMAGSTGAGVP